MSKLERFCDSETCIQYIVMCDSIIAQFASNQTFVAKVPECMHGKSGW